MKDTIFKNLTEMPPVNNSPDVVRTSTTMPEMRKYGIPASVPNPDASVENIQRPRRGHGY
jgi:hypothetical protein